VAPPGPNPTTLAGAQRTATSDIDGVRGTTLSAPPRHTPTGGEWNSVVPRARIGLHESWRNTALGPIIGDDGKLDLSRLTPEMFKNLGPDNRRVLMNILGRETVDASTQTADGTRRNERLNGATAVAGMMWASGDSTAFAQAFAAAPERVLPHLSGGGTRVLTAENMATIMREMSSSDGRYEPAELNALGSLVQKYLERNAGEDPARARASMEQLMGAINRSGMDPSTSNVGVVTGSVISGMLKHFDAINASDTTRNNIVNGMFDGLTAAAGGFGPWGAAVGAGLVGLRTIFNEANPPRDYTEVANRLQGAIQLDWLQGRNLPPDWSREDMHNALHWIQTTILNNGRR
jgi:hypothetical protein